MIAQRTDIRLTHSEKQCAKTCLRKHYLAYQVGIRLSRSAKPLRLGSAGHLGVDYDNRRRMGHEEWKGKSDNEIIWAVLERYDRQKPDDPEQLEDHNYEKAVLHAILTGYFWRWSEMKMDILASEQSYELPIINPNGNAMISAVQAGKIDGIVRLPDGRVAIKETKFLSADLSPESDFWLRLRIDTQISDYYNAALALGYDIQTVYYDVVRKPTLKPRNIEITDEDGLKQVFDLKSGERCRNKNGTFKQSISDKEFQWIKTRKESPEEYTKRILDDIYARPDFYYARKEIPRLKDDLEETNYEQWQMAKLINDCKKNNRWPRNTDACKNHFGTCPYFSLCTSDYQPGDHVEGYIYVEDVHQELTDDN